MTCGRPKRICSGNLRHGITIERRSLDAPVFGSGELRHAFQIVLTTRAEIKTKKGNTEFNRVEIDGVAITHVMTIRHTPVAFDIRDRVRDGSGNLYGILSIEDVDEYGDWLRLYCARQGAEDRKAAA